MTTATRGTVLHMGTGASRRTRAPWVEVLSHLDPKYGGLSSVVPQMASRVASRVVLGESVPVQIAAFCSPGEQRALPGYPELTVSHWPTAPLMWMREAELKSEWERLLRASEGVHIHGLWETSTRVAAQTARRLRKPYVVSAHGMLEPWALRNKALKKRVYAALVERTNLGGAACLHALTEAEAEDYRRFGVDRPIAVIPNGVTAPESADPELFLEAFPEARGRRVVLFLGRIHFKKGLDLLARAWGELATRFPETLLVLAGPDSENSQAAVEKLIAARGIEDRVLFTGMLGSELKWSALAAAECFVLPSYSEGLSMATLEAMSLGVPVIVTTNCHLPEVSRTGAGWEIEATEPALREALEAMLTAGPEKNGERGLLGRGLVADRFSWEQVGRQMAELYRWISDGVRPQSFDLQEAGA